MKGHLKHFEILTPTWPLRDPNWKGAKSYKILSKYFLTYNDLKTINNSFSSKWYLSTSSTLIFCINLFNSYSTIYQTPKNSRSLSWTQVLIIGLGNDVNLNSGPPLNSPLDDPPAPCRSCGDEVAYYPGRAFNVKSVKNWNHTACINMSSKTYDPLANSSTSWICNGCGHSIFLPR